MTSLQGRPLLSQAHQLLLITYFTTTGKDSRAVYAQIPQKIGFQPF